MTFIGIDLSGPSNLSDTTLLAFCQRGRHLKLVESIEGASDLNIAEMVKQLSREGLVVIGLDAPLSYNPGGGLRSSDQSLKKRVIEAGLRPGSVMPPTLNRMAYLTLRGISVARLLKALAVPVVIVEVHPGAAFALRGAPIEAVRTFKQDLESRLVLLSWLAQQGLKGLYEQASVTDHYVAAAAAALAAWKWHKGDSIWLHAAEPLLHPFDFAC